MALVVLILGIIASTLFDFESMGIHIVGEIPAGLPDFGIPEGLGLEELLAVARRRYPHLVDLKVRDDGRFALLALQQKGNRPTR